MDPRDPSCFLWRKRVDLPPERGDIQRETLASRNGIDDSTAHPDRARITAIRAEFPNFQCAQCRIHEPVPLDSERGVFRNFLDAIPPFVPWCRRDDLDGDARRYANTTASR